MILCFDATVAVGFILTTVQIWVGRSSLSKKPVAVLILLWVLMRLAI